MAKHSRTRKYRQVLTTQLLSSVIDVRIPKWCFWEVGNSERMFQVGKGKHMPDPEVPSASRKTSIRNSKNREKKALNREHSQNERWMKTEYKHWEGIGE